jgi:3-oxoacyl-[acyl-carrier-protein] synthase II
VSEGAAVVVLEELEHAKARGATILAELRGYGCSGDAYHMTAPREDGSGALLSMKRALANSSITPADVDYINAHATGTAVGDAAEAAAIRSLMLGSEGIQNASHITLSSTKGAIGHLLGAAGAIEAIFSILAVAEVRDVILSNAQCHTPGRLTNSQNAVPPTLNLHESDVDIDMNFVPLHAQQRTVDVALSNSFGFGGTNATLVFSKLGLKM